jgi:hypothetical protein
MASAVGTTAGLLSNGDYTAFSNRLGTFLPSANIYVGSSTGIAQQRVVTGDISLNNTGVATVTGLRGRPVSSTAPVVDQVLVYDSSQYAPRHLGVADILSTISPYGGVFANTSCSVSQTMYWSSPSGTFECQNIALNVGSVTGAVNKAGDTMTGNLNMNANSITGVNDIGTLRVMANDYVALGGAAGLTIQGNTISVNSTSDLIIRGPASGGGPAGVIIGPATTAEAQRPTIIRSGSDGVMIQPGNDGLKVGNPSAAYGPNIAGVRAVLKGSLNGLSIGATNIQTVTFSGANLISSSDIVQCNLNAAANGSPAPLIIDTNNYWKIESVHISSATQVSLLIVKVGSPTYFSFPVTISNINCLVHKFGP